MTFTYPEGTGAGGGPTWAQAQASDQATGSGVAGSVANPQAPAPAQYGYVNNAGQLVYSLVPISVDALGDVYPTGGGTILAGPNYGTGAYGPGMVSATGAVSGGPLQANPPQGTPTTTSAGTPTVAANVSNTTLSTTEIAIILVVIAAIIGAVLYLRRKK